MRHRLLARLGSALCLGFAIVIGMLADTACSHSSARPVMVSSGARGWYIECSRNQGACLDEAAHRCPRGYVIEGAEQHAGRTTYRAAAFGGGVVARPRFEGSMTVECR